MKFSRRAALLGISIAAIVNPALGQNEITEIVVQGDMGRFSATKSNTPIMETARSVSIETQQDLLDKGALNVADAYLYTAGVFGEQYGFATRGDWLSVRGLDVPEYRDSLQALFGSYNNTRPDIYTIEQVEILKGPASVLYGQGSPGGIVNVTSKVPQEETSREVVAELGNYNRVQLATDMTGKLTEDGSWLYRLTAVYRDTDTQVDHVGEKALVLAPSLTWRPDENTNLTFLLNLQDTESQAGAQFYHIYGTLLPSPNGKKIDPSTFSGEPGFDHYDTESQSFTILGEHQLNQTWSVEGTARYTKGDSNYNQAWAAFIGGDRYVYNDDGSLYGDGAVPRSFYTAVGSSEQLAFDARLRASFATADLEHEVLMGVMFQDVTTDDATSYMYALGYDFATGGPDAVLGDRYWINTFDPVYTGNFPGQEISDLFFNDTPEANTKDMGIYINDQIDMDAWSFLLGLRYDDVENDNSSSVQSDDAISYSIGGLYQFENGVSPYISYAESFEPVVGIDSITGDQLNPREGEQLELGLKYQNSNGVVATLSYFDIEESNLSNPNSLMGGNSQQEGISKINGTEFEALIPLGEFSVEINASVLDTENPNGYRFASVPEKQASTWVNYRPTGSWEGFRAGLGIRYVGESWDGTDTLSVPSYTLADMMLGYSKNKWDTTLHIRNLSDKDYIATCLGRGDCFLGENQTVVARITRKF